MKLGLSSPRVGIASVLLGVHYLGPWCSSHLRTGRVGFQEFSVVEGHQSPGEAFHV